MRNTIVAISPAGDSCYGVITGEGNNLDSGSSCGWGSNSGSLSNIDPRLGPAANNGGATPTMMLWPDSPAIDGVIFDAPNGRPATDQRGVPRPIGPRCDIGVFQATTPWHAFLPIVAIHSVTAPALPIPPGNMLTLTLSSPYFWTDLSHLVYIAPTTIFWGRYYLAWGQLAKRQQCCQTCGSRGPINSRVGWNVRDRHRPSGVALKPAGCRTWGAAQ